MNFLEEWFAPDFNKPSFLIGRWIWLRALGGIFFSVFYSLYFQIHGLIGPNGLLPAEAFLEAVRHAIGWKRYWLIPSLLWIHAGDRALDVLVWTGFAASLAIIVNLWPRVSIAVAGICFLSFIAVAQDFASYQSDGMLLEAALLSIFLAPRGLRPGLAADRPPSKASLFLLRWEWFRIYFESGVVKILSGEPQWRDLTAMDKYYENGPLPTWIGWYVQHWPHAFHAGSAAFTLIAELLIAWLAFFPKWSKRIAFILTTPLQIGIILTANYAFLNYLVLFLGFLLVDDEWFRGLEVARSRGSDSETAQPRDLATWPAAVVLPIIFVTTVASFFLPYFPTVVMLEPYRVANSYGLFAIMTRARYEIEFQGTADGKTWIAYPFPYKPQDVRKPPGIYAPYQPRFEWNLWFASLGTWVANRWVLNTEVRLLQNQPAVLQLFAGNPFASKPPQAVRAMQWQYWFTSVEERNKTGAWWRRELIGQYAPTARRMPDGTIEIETTETP
ncbi:MAG TPA: lipase maturation factor family protein [Thermoanaerobaculia bacterium]|nr:lipase maturation factor family protein [Thermoanaerobaculia bacterium]